jgi:hypothetical protein
MFRKKSDKLEGNAAILREMLEEQSGVSRGLPQGQCPEFSTKGLGPGLLLGGLGIAGVLGLGMYVESRIQPLDWPSFVDHIPAETPANPAPDNGG